MVQTICSRTWYQYGFFSSHRFSFYGEQTSVCLVVSGSSPHQILILGNVPEAFSRFQGWHRHPVAVVLLAQKVTQQPVLLGTQT